MHTADYFTVGCLSAYKSVSLFTKQKNKKQELSLSTVLYNLHVRHTGAQFIIFMFELTDIVMQRLLT